MAKFRIFYIHNFLNDPTISMYKNQQVFDGGDFVSEISDDKELNMTVGTGMANAIRYNRSCTQSIMLSRMSLHLYNFIGWS